MTAYLNPSSEYVISETQKEDVEKNIRYQMMLLMRSGLVDSELALVEHVRYISPLVVMSEKERTDAESQPYLHFTETSDSAGMTVTISILIIAACFTIIGAAGLILTVKVLYRQDEENYSTVKQPRTYVNDTIVHNACGNEERNMWEQDADSHDNFMSQNHKMRMKNFYVNKTSLSRKWHIQRKKARTYPVTMIGVLTQTCQQQCDVWLLPKKYQC